jgi:AAA15 family ATPase/GTPase
MQYNNYKIILLENCPCNSKDELHARERFHIENNESIKCINITKRPKVSLDEVMEDNRERQRKFYEKNGYAYKKKRNHFQTECKRLREMLLD